MAKGIIRLLYKKVIDVNSSKAWEKCAFNDSYSEFLMQSQLYNREKKYTSFSELQANVPNADKLHFLVSASVTGYLQQFSGLVPDITNAAGKAFLPFKQYRFEILASDITNINKHRIALHFITAPLLWIDTIGEQLLVAVNNTPQNDETVLTDMLALTPFLTIHSYKQTPHLWYHNQTEKSFLQKNAVL